MSSRCSAALTAFTFLSSLACARPVQAGVERFALLVGNDQSSEDAPLRYAETDAERVYDVLKGVGGFAPANMILLKGETAANVERSMIALNDRVRAAVGARNQVVLFVYYSGHADARGLHLGATRLELALLEQLVRSSAAAFRILVVDACRSGALTRVKGGRPAPPFLVQVDEHLNGEGTVFLTSSALNEDAQESDEIQGSFFTHYFRSGLLGAADADADGKVTLDEAYRHAHDGTLRASSRSWAGMQHPTFQYELRGQGRLVLSEVGPADRSRAQLAFPPDRDYLVLTRDEAGAVVAEVSRYAKGRFLSVTPGQYFVRGRAQSFLLEGALDVAPGQRLDVEDARLARVEYARLARKGGAEPSTAHGPLLGYTFRTPLANGNALCHGAFAAYALAFSELTLTPRLSACLSGFENEYLSARSNEYSAEVKLSHTWDLPLLGLEVGLAAGGALLEQAFHSPASPRARRSAAAHFSVNVGASLDIAAGVYGVAEVAAQSYAFSLQRSSDEDSEWAASLAYRQYIGIGKYW